MWEKKKKQKEEETQQTNTGKKPDLPKEWGIGRVKDFFEDWWKNEVINEDGDKDDKDDELM